MPNTTVDGTTSIPNGPPAEAPRVLALVVLASVAEPQRVGEIILVPARSAHGGFDLGRGSEHNGSTRLGFARQRAGILEHTGVISDGRISRRQLRIRQLDASTLELQNVGRCTVLKNGQEFAVGVLRPGDRLALDRRWLFLCEERPAWLAPLPAPIDFEFGAPDGDGIVGETPAVWQLRRTLRSIAEKPGHVLVRGPTGAGKELIVQALHRHSPRGHLPLISRNAVTIPEGLVDAELFGNIRNYPHAGMAARSGLVGEADGSSLFLDEFAEIPLASQTHLLRVLDSGEYQPLGGAQSLRADLRLLAATNRPVESLRPDLLARFTWQIEVPPLSDRRADIPLIAKQLCSGFGGTLDLLSLPAVDLLVSGDLSANVRGVRRRLAELAQHGLPPHPAPADSPTPPAINFAGRAAEDGEKDGLHPERIQACLEAHNGSLTDTAKALGLSNRHALARLVRRHGLVVRKRVK